MRMFGIVLLLAISSSELKAQSSCSATNDNQDQTCSISCPAGQAAQCTNGVGSSPPACECSGTPENALTRSGHFQLLKSSRFELLDNRAIAPTGIQTTNVLDVIDAKLAALPDHHISNQCHQEGTGQFCPLPTVCFPTSRTVCQPVNGKLTIQAPLIISSGPTVKVQDPNWQDIPSEIFMQHGDYHNCSSTQQSESFQHAQQLQVGDTITKTKTLSTGSSQAIQISAGLHVGIVNFGGSDTLSFSTTSQITDTNTENHSESITNSVTLPVVVPAMSDVQIKHSYIQYNVPVPFTGTVTVDGQLASNLDGLSLLSQVLPNAADRTFDFAGFVTDSTLIDARTEVHQKTLTATDCQDSNGRLTQTTKFANHF